MSTPCGPGIDYRIYIDWFGTGTVAASGNDFSADVLGEGSWASSYGRDQARQLSPGAVGTASWGLCNVSREFSPENASSPLFGVLGPGVAVEFHVLWAPTDYRLFTGRVDDFTVHADFSNRNVDFTGLDALSDLQTTDLSTAVYQALRTGEIINTILDLVGWDPALRDLDLGATFPPYWWAEGKDALTAVLEVVAAEGPPAIAYVDPAGVFVFKDRHHRLLDPVSLTSQAEFSAGPLGEC